MPVITDLAAGAGIPAGSAVVSVRAKVHFASVCDLIIAVCIIRFTLGDDALPPCAERPSCIRKGCIAFRPAGPAVAHIRVQVNALLTAQGFPAFCAGRAAPGVHADLQLPAGAAADPAVFLVSEEITTGTATEDIAMLAGRLGGNGSHSKGTRPFYVRTRLQAPAVLAGIPGRASVPAGPAVPGIGLQITTRAAAYYPAGGTGRGRHGSGRGDTG